MKSTHPDWMAQAIAVAAIVCAGAPALAASTPSVGDVNVYQAVNGYSKEVRGRVSYRITAAAADRLTYSVVPDKPAAGVQRTEVYTAEGNWLKHSLESHGFPLDYEFATAYPSYAFPLEPGKSWSVRVGATVQNASRPRSVRVDGRVLGTERVRVPAGEFDAIKIKRLVYLGDAVGTLTETQVIELEWYVPSLGRTVRLDRQIEWTDLSRCLSSGCMPEGDWSVLELVETRAAKP